MYTPWSMKEGCDKNDMNTVTHRCGTRYQGYLEFRHPTVSEGYVERIVCYQDATVPCECQFNSIIGKLLYAERMLLWTARNIALFFDIPCFLNEVVDP